MNPQLANRLIVTGGFVLIYRHEIKEILGGIFSYLYSYFYRSATINVAENPRCSFALREEVLQTVDAKWNTRVTDGTMEPNFNLGSQSYTIKHPKYGRISFDLTDDQITIKTSSLNDIANIKAYIEEIYNKHSSSESSILLMTADKDKWSFPIFRKPRDKAKLTLTPPMTKMMGDVNEFLNSESEYTKRSQPYRRGYLLYGITGSGKTTMVELLAATYDMPVYMVTFNSTEMTDTVLINLLSKVPKRSIIVVEEIDKQLERLNDNNMLTIGGILTAFDGPQRLNDSSILILTANKYKFLSTEHMKSLIRPGRIDQVYCFGEEPTQSPVGASPTRVPVSIFFMVVIVLGLMLRYLIHNLL